MSITPSGTSNIISISIINRQSRISKVFSGYLHSPGSNQSTRFLESVTDWLTLLLQERLVTLERDTGKSDNKTHYNYKTDTKFSKSKWNWKQTYNNERCSVSQMLRPVETKKRWKREGLKEWLGDKSFPKNLLISSSVPAPGFCHLYFCSCHFYARFMFRWGRNTQLMVPSGVITLHPHLCWRFWI